MKRLFSVLFVVCAVCIFPKLSLAAGDGVSCENFCMICGDDCVEALEEKCGCPSGQKPSYCKLTNEPSRDCDQYNGWSAIGVTCGECVSSGGNTPSTSTTCTVRFCPNDDICPSNFIVDFGSSSHKSGDSLDTPSYTQFKELGGSIQPNKFLKGWSRGIGEDANNILDPGTEVTILCNNNEDVYYYSSWGVCGSGTYASQGSCESCEKKYKCPNGVQEECDNGYYQNEEGKSTCKACLPGEYSGSNINGFLFCSSIPGGSYCTHSNSDGGCYAITGCTAGSYCTGGKQFPCAAGSYSKANAASCTLCNPGEYQGETGKTLCALCSGGSYSSSSGATTCTECTGGVASDCSLEDSSKGCKKCTPCSAGYYCVGGASAPVGTGHYATGCGTNHTSDCVGEDANCEGCTGETICLAGSYCTGGRKFGVSTGYYGIDCNSEGNGCTWQEICPVGSYCTGGKKFTCVDGTISDSTGATTCKSCPPGSYCKDGVIKTCEAGTYSTGGAATCTPCPEGSYSGSGASSCTLCEPAKYQDKTKQISCHDVPKGHYATGCREGALDDDKNCVGANCRGCKWHSICPDASVGERYYCSSGQKLSCAATNQLTECVDDNKGCTVCKACDDGKIVDGNGTLCDDCPAGYYCKGGVKYACLASEGEYQADEGRTSCELIPNGSRCSGKKQDGACPGTEYCTDYKYTNKDIYVDKSECQTVPAGSYATYCSSPGTGCKGYAECPAIDNEGKGYYCMSGKRNVCNAGSYLSDCKSGSTGCQECKSCPDGTTFAATVVVGVGNCGLQTCLDYYNKAKEGTGVWEEWYDNWSQCSSDGSSLAGCYMAPTKGINGAPVDTGAGTKPKCCSEGGTLEKCSYDNGMESCIATCTGCTGGNAQGGGCTADQMKLTDKHTCPGVQEVNKPSTCAATIACTCRYNDNLDLCNNYLNNATNGDKVCYKNEDGKDRTNYCETFCYKECDDSPCTQQCGNITVKTGVKGCTDKEDKYPGRQFKNNPECKYYDNGVPGTAPYCSVDITCKENYHKPRTTGCTPCLEGYHTKDDNTEEECTPNVYKVTLNRAGGENGTTEFFYEYKTKDDCYYYSNYNSTNGIVSGCLDVVDGKQTVQKPTRKGYTFAGYYTEADGKGTQYVDNAGKISEAIYTTLYDKTLYAKWTPNVYKVTLNPAPGSGGTSNYFYQYETKGKCYYYTSEDLSTCIEGTGGVQINKPTRTGYTFDGYYTEADGKGTQYVDKDGTTIGSIYKTIGDKTLFAKWTPNVFTVNFNRNDGATGAAAPESKTCTYDQACTAATQGTMRKTNHVFKGWDRDKEKDGDGEFGAEGDITNIISEGEITLYAIWKECDACVQSTGSKCELKVEDNECTYESGCIDGYTVVERTKDTNKPECTANEYSAIYFCGEGGGTPDPESDPVRFNDPYTVDISHRECSKPGSLFLGWEGKNNEDTIFAPYNVETEFTWAEVGDIEFTAKWDACPKGYYCGDGRVEQKECPVGSTTGGGADEIIDCYLLGGQSKICSKIGNEEPKCFTLPAGVKVNYSGDWRPSAE